MSKFFFVLSDENGYLSGPWGAIFVFESIYYLQTFIEECNSTDHIKKHVISLEDLKSICRRVIVNYSGKMEVPRVIDLY